MSNLIAPESGKVITLHPALDALIPKIFTDPRFRKTGRRRWLLHLDGVWVGFVVAWCPPTYENFGLNREDIERLIEKMGDGSLDAGYVVLAFIANGQPPSYLAHRDGHLVYDTVKAIPPHYGQYGHYWLIRDDFSPIDDLAQARLRF